MEVHARSGLADGDLGREGDLDAVGVGDLAQHPLGEDHLISGVHHVDGQEFNFLLDHLPTISNEVADLGVRVLHGTSHTHQVEEGFSTHVFPLREGA